MTITDTAAEAAGTERRLAWLCDRLTTPAARMAGSILWILMSGGVALLAGSLTLVACAYFWPDAHGFALSWDHFDAAWNALVVFVGLLALPRGWRWYRSQRVIIRDES